MPNAEPPADDALDDDEVVIRKISDFHLKSMPNRMRRVSTSAFSESSKNKDPERGMSVDCLSTLLENGIDPNDPQQFAPEFEVLMTLNVGDLRALGLDVVRRPISGTYANPAHCNVLGVRSSKRKKLLELANFLRAPDGIVKGED